MKYSYIQLTDEGKRQLMRELSRELTDKKIALCSAIVFCFI